MASQTYGPGLIDHFVGKLISSVDPTKKMAHCFPPYSMCHLFLFFQEAAIFSWNVAHSSCPPTTHSYDPRQHRISNVFLEKGIEREGGVLKAVAFTICRGPNRSEELPLCSVLLGLFWDLTLKKRPDW